MIPKTWRGVLLWLAVVITSMVVCTTAVAQTSTATVPPLIKFSGTLSSVSGSTVGVTFALYAEQTGGAPLWLETQNVTPDANGRYTIYLGANHAGGVPLDLFASAEARWLGVQPEGQPEQARILLTSVPYALTAGDAQTLGGQPLSAFVLASAANGATTASTNSAATANAAGGGIVALASPQGSPTTVTTVWRPDQLPGEIHRGDQHRELGDLRHGHGGWHRHDDSLGDSACVDHDAAGGLFRCLFGFGDESAEYHADGEPGGARHAARDVAGSQCGAVE
jgi:hypothetical protein